jgi:hypothetical protein
MSPYRGIIPPHHLWAHTYLMKFNEPFQEYWECRFCGLRINLTDAMYPGPITICDKEIPEFVQARMNEANKNGCPYYIVEGIMEL